MLFPAFLLCVTFFVNLPDNQAKIYHLINTLIPLISLLYALRVWIREQCTDLEIVASWIKRMTGHYYPLATLYSHFLWWRSSHKFSVDSRTIDSTRRYFTFNVFAIFIYHYIIYRENKIPIGFAACRRSSCFFRCLGSAILERMTSIVVLAKFCF